MVVVSCDYSGELEQLKRNMKPCEDEYFLRIASTVATTSNCIRRKYGAVIVEKDKISAKQQYEFGRIVGYGSNQATLTSTSCNVTGTCWRMENNIPHGKMYEMCKSVHAEQNAIISSELTDLSECVLYLVGYDCTEQNFIEAEPCYICAKMLYSMGLRFVITMDSSKGARRGSILLSLDNIIKKHENSVKDE